MNWANLAFMNGQQAPTARPTVSERQSRRLDPVQTASMNRNFTVGHTSATMMMMLTSVRAVLNGPSNSRARVRAVAAALAAGGGSGSSTARRMYEGCEPTAI